MLEHGASSLCDGVSLMAKLPDLQELALKVLWATLPNRSSCHLQRSLCLGVEHPCILCSRLGCIEIMLDGPHGSLGDTHSGACLVERMTCMSELLRAIEHVG